MNNPHDNSLDNHCADENLHMFIKSLKKASKDFKNNYLFPLKNDYRNVIEYLQNMDYITDVASHIQYNFDENTKNKIKSYSQQHMAKINELFN